MYPENLSPETTSASLLLQLRQGDQEAWKRFADLYGPLLAHWVKRWFERNDLEPVGLDDIVQNVFVRVNEYIGKFERSRSASFRKWLHRISDSQASDFFARHCKEEPTLSPTGIDRLHRIASPEIPFDESMDEPEEDKRILLQSILKMIETDFQPQTWQAFYLMAVEGRPAKDVADELGISAVAVRRAKHRVLQRIHEEFGEITE